MNVGGEIQRRVVQGSLSSGVKDPSRLERFFGAPMRNREEINRIIQKFGSGAAKEINFTLRKFDEAATYPLRPPVAGMDTFVDIKGILDFFVGSRARRFNPWRKDYLSDTLLHEMRELASVQPRVRYVNIGGVQGAAIQLEDTKANREYLAAAEILRIQARRQLNQLLMGRVPAAVSLERRLKEEERKYQELLAGFRSGWVIGTAFVAIKQGIERILNSPVLRKAYLETFAVVVGLIPVIGPLIARVMRAAAVDMDFDIGDFLRELFAEGVGKVFEVMALAAIGSALPPGTSVALRKVAEMGGKVVGKTVGASGATRLIRNVNRVKTQLTDKAKESVRKVAA